VEGPHLAAVTDDEAKNVLKVVEDVTRGNAQHCEPVPSQDSVTRSIASRLVAAVMTLAIDLNNQTSL